MHSCVLQVFSKGKSPRTSSQYPSSYTVRNASTLFTNVNTYRKSTAVTYMEMITVIPDGSAFSRRTSLITPENLYYVVQPIYCVKRIVRAIEIDFNDLKPRRHVRTNVPVDMMSKRLVTINRFMRTDQYLLNL